MDIYINRNVGEFGAVDEILQNILHLWCIGKPGDIRYQSSGAPSKQKMIIFASKSEDLISSNKSHKLLVLSFWLQRCTGSSKVA